MINEQQEQEKRREKKMGTPLPAAKEGGNWKK